VRVIAQAKCSNPFVRCSRRAIVDVVTCPGLTAPLTEKPLTRLSGRSYESVANVSRNCAVITRIVGALATPTSVALACRWGSRPQHQKRT
jgi:hypothetical protein